MLDDIFSGNDWRALMAKGFIAFCLIAPLAYCEASSQRDKATKELSTELSMNELQLACINKEGSWSRKHAECTFDKDD